MVQPFRYVVLLNGEFHITFTHYPEHAFETARHKYANSMPDEHAELYEVIDDHWNLLALKLAVFEPGSY